MNTENVTYFDSFRVEHTPKENAKTNIYRIQAYAWIFFIGSIDFMLKGKCLLDYTNLFSPNEYKKNDKY